MRPSHAARPQQKSPLLIMKWGRYNWGMKRLVTAIFLFCCGVGASPSHAATCKGGICHVCKNCRHCAHCNSGGRCSVCSGSIRGSSTPRVSRGGTASTQPSTYRIPSRPYAQDKTLEPSWIRQQRLEQQLKIPKAKPAKSDNAIRCIQVLDGKVLKISQNGNISQLVLYGIQCPLYSQPFYYESKQHLELLALNKTIRFYEVSGAPLNAGWIFAGQKCLNSMQIQDGYAFWDKKGAPLQFNLRDLEATAQATKAGLWKDPSFVRTQTALFPLN